MSRVLGVDVSKYQGQMDWLKCYEAGARFAIIRAGYSSLYLDANYTDAQFERNASIAPGYMPMGCYWFFMPNHNPINQADYFCNLIASKERILDPVVDIERNGGLNSSAAAVSLEAFVQRIYSNLQVWPLIYTRSTFWNPAIGDSVLWKELELWIARYTSLPEPWGNPGDQAFLKPRDWNTWSFWQFSADGNGRGDEFGAQSASIDLDYFNGDQHDFDEYCGFDVPTVDGRLDILEREAIKAGWSLEP